jgi:hypothetical protein
MNGELSILACISGPYGEVSRKRYSRASSDTLFPPAAVTHFEMELSWADVLPLRSRESGT